MTFTELARYAAFLVPIDRERVRKFIEGLNFGIRYGMAREVETNTTFHQAIEISRHLECMHRKEGDDRDAKRPRGSSECLIWRLGVSQ